MDSKYIRFDEQPCAKGHVTLSWHVYANSGNFPLGTVSWNPGWRKYCFVPQPNCWFDENCLADIGSFLNQQTVARQIARRAEKSQMSQ